MKTLAKRNPTEVAVRKPEDFVRHGNIGIQDMEIPALKLLQGLSPEVKEHQHLRAGTFYHSILERDLGPKITVVVELVHRSVDLWSPKNVRGIESRLLARAADGENWDKPNQRFTVTLEGGKQVEWFTSRNVSASGLLSWGSSDPQDPSSFPAARIVYTIIQRIMEPNNINSPCIYIPSPTARKSVMRLNSKIDMRMDLVPPLQQLYELSAVEQQGRNNTSWFVPQWNAAGELKDEALFEKLKVEAKRLADHYPSIRVVGGSDEGDDDAIPFAGATNAAF